MDNHDSTDRCPGWGGEGLVEREQGSDYQHSRQKRARVALGLAGGGALQGAAASVTEPGEAVGYVAVHDVAVYPRHGPACRERAAPADGVPERFDSPQVHK